MVKYKLHEAAYVLGSLIKKIAFNKTVHDTVIKKIFTSMCLKMLRVANALQGKSFRSFKHLCLLIEHNKILLTPQTFKCLNTYGKVSTKNSSPLKGSNSWSSTG